MASSSLKLHLLLLCLCLIWGFCRTARNPTALGENHQQPLDATTLMSYHKGQLLTGPISVNLIWYGSFTPAQRSIISDFVTSLSTPSSPRPTVAAWWKTVGDMYYRSARTSFPTLSLNSHILDTSCSLGKSLHSSDLPKLAAKGGDMKKNKKNTINIVLTAADVAVEGFCMSHCGTHAASSLTSGSVRSAYIWVGNSALQCPGQCAWPFHQPLYGPQSQPLVAPNADVGVDGMVINLAALLAGAVTNPFGDGYYQGSDAAPLEAATACSGVYGKGAYPGYAGELLVDPTTGASYNAGGAHGRKFLLPGLFDPSTSVCSTLV